VSSSIAQRLYEIVVAEFWKDFTEHFSQGDLVCMEKLNCF